MPYNGSGSFTRNFSWVNDAASNIPITATRMDADSNDIASALSDCVTRDGQSPATANLPMGNHKLTGLSNGSARTDSVAVGQIQDGTFEYLTTVSGSNTITASMLGLTAYVAGQTFRFVPASNNTGTTTINIQGVGAAAITKNGTTALGGGELISGTTYQITYDGTQFQLLGQLTSAAYVSYNATTTLSVGQLGSIVSFYGSTASQILTLPAVASSPAGRSFQFRNAASVPVTVQANASEQIEGLYLGTGASSANTIVLYPGDSTTLISDGTLWHEQEGVRATAQNGLIQGQFKNLQGSANGTTAAVTFTADAIVLKNSANAYATLYTGSLTANTGAASGVVNSLDTGVWAFSTWYYVFVISGTSGTGLLFSLSATAPTLPSGYTYFARVGAIRTQSATNYNPLGFKQYGKRVQYISTGAGIYPAMSSGVQGVFNATTTTWVAVGIGNFVPPTAASIRTQITCPSTGGIAVAAPNNTQSGGWGNSVQPLMSNINTSSGVVESVLGDFAIESTNIYFASASAANILACIGWEDNL